MDFISLINKYERKLNKLKRDIEEYKNSNNQELKVASTTLEEIKKEVELLVQAVEKQIPLKPIKNREQETRYTSAYSCPTCDGGFSGTGIAKHCYHCGQKLDWDEMEFENEKDL